MTSRFLTTRREVLQRLGIAVSGIAVGLPAGAGSPTEHPGADLGAAMSDLIRHPESAAIIGAVYIAQSGDNYSAADFAHDIDKRLRAIRGKGYPHIDASDLAALIRADFVSGDVVNVGGWILSRTEARLCATYAA